MENKNTSAIEEFSKMLTESELESARNMINEVTDSLDFEESLTPAIHESIFVNSYLDYFKNIKTSDPNSPLYLNWINIAGSVYNEVHLVNDKGEVVATVPPLVARNSIETDNLENVGFEEKAKHYNLLKGVDGDRAKNFLATELSALPKFIKPVTAQDEAKRWVALFNRYSNNKNEKETKPATSKVKENLGIDYD